VGQRKVERAQEALREEIGCIIHDEMKDPRIGFASVVRVEVSPDIRHARVFVSVLGSEEEKSCTLQGLEGAKGFIRSELGKRLRLRFTPEITFRLDDSIERGVRISRLLEEMGSGEDEGAEDQ